MVDKSQIETVKLDDSLETNEVETEIVSKSNKSCSKDDNSISNVALNKSVESSENDKSRNVILVFEFKNIYFLIVQLTITKYVSVWLKKIL